MGLLQSKKQIITPSHPYAASLSHSCASNSFADGRFSASSVQQALRNSYSPSNSSKSDTFPSFSILSLKLSDRLIPFRSPIATA